jgi:hypothetical protein
MSEERKSAAAGFWVAVVVIVVAVGWAACRSLGHASDAFIIGAAGLAAIAALQIAFSLRR